MFQRLRNLEFIGDPELHFLTSSAMRRRRRGRSSPRRSPRRRSQSPPRAPPAPPAPAPQAPPTPPTTATAPATARATATRQPPRRGRSRAVGWVASAVSRGFSTARSERRSQPEEEPQPRRAEDPLPPSPGRRSRASPILEPEGSGRTALLAEIARVAPVLVEESGGGPPPPRPLPPLEPPRHLAEHLAQRGVIRDNLKTQAQELGPLVALVKATTTPPTEKAELIRTLGPVITQRGRLLREMQRENTLIMRLLQEEDQKNEAQSTPTTLEEVNRLKEYDQWVKTAIEVAAHNDRALVPEVSALTKLVAFLERMKRELEGRQREAPTPPSSGSGGSQRYVSVQERVRERAARGPSVQPRSRGRGTAGLEKFGEAAAHLPEAWRPHIPTTVGGGV